MAGLLRAEDALAPPPRRAPRSGPRACRARSSHESAALGLAAHSLFFPVFMPSGRGARSRATSGRCSSASMRLACSKEVSSAKPMVGATRSSTVVRQLAAQEAAGAFQRLHRLAGMRAAQRHDIGGGVLQIGRNPHLGHGQGQSRQRRIAQPRPARRYAPARGAIPRPPARGAGPARCVLVSASVSATRQTPRAP